MKILSLCHDEINKELDNNIKKLKIVKINSLIQDIHYPQSLKGDIKEEYINEEIYNIKDDYDFVLLDLLTIINKHIKYKNKILLEEALSENINKKMIKTISKEDIVYIGLQSANVLINELIYKYHISKIILMNVEVANENNDILSKLYKMVLSDNPGISTTEKITVYPNDNNKIFIKSDEDISKVVQESIKNIKIFEKEKIHKSIRNIRYYFEPAKVFNKNKLIIIFSAFSKDKPKYNYIKSLLGIDCNKLYILDDYGEKGCYYLGLDGNFDIETSVMSLISKIMREKNINFNNIISAGTSKGGSAALYYGLKYNFKEVIVGAPQYKIGSYLSDLSIRTYGNDIFGEINEQNRIKYDNLIRKVVNSNYTKISILTSDGDNQYEKLLKDIEYLLIDRSMNFNIDKCDINHHNEISSKFPEYLNRKIVHSLNNVGCINNKYIKINKILNLLKKHAGRNNV